MDRRQHCETAPGRDKSCNVPSSKEIPGNEPKFSATQARDSDHDDHASDGMAVVSISPTRASAIDEHIAAELWKTLLFDISLI